MGNLGNHGRSLEEADVGQAPMLRPAAAFAAVLSVLDLAIVWGWHAPVLHDVARGGSEDSGSSRGRSRSSPSGCG